MAHPPHRAGPGTNRQGRPSGAGTTIRARQERRRDQAADQLESDVQRWWQSWYTDPNWSWAGFPCQRDNVAQRARSRDDREWTWSRETGWQHTGGQAPLQKGKGKGAGKGRGGGGKGQGGGGKGGGQPSQQGTAAPKPKAAPPAQPAAAAAAPAAPKQPAAPAADGTGGTPSQEGIQAKAPPVSKPKQKAMPQVVQPKAKAVEEKAKAATPGLMRATPKPPPPPLARGVAGLTSLLFVFKGLRGLGFYFKGCRGLGFKASDF